MEEEIRFPKNDGPKKPQKHRGFTIFLIVGLLLVAISAVGIRAYRKQVADEARRQEVAAAEARRMAVLQTIRSAHDFFGKGDWPQAARWCEKAAIEGDAPSQRYWGECLEKALGVLARPEDAVGWYRKAAAAGDVPAKTLLADCMAHGRGCGQDAAGAVRLYREAAEAGDAAAQLVIGDMLAEGRELEKSPTEAVAWYRKAAEQGHSRAQAKLGNCLS